MRPISETVNGNGPKVFPDGRTAYPLQMLQVTATIPVYDQFFGDGRETRLVLNGDRIYIGRQDDPLFFQELTPEEAKLYAREISTYRLSQTYY